MEKKTLESGKLMTPYIIYADHVDFTHERIHIAQDGNNHHTTLCNKSLDLENFARKRHVAKATCPMCINEYDQRMNKKMAYPLEILRVAKAGIEADYRRVISKVRDRAYNKEEKKVIPLMEKKMKGLEEAILVLEEFNI